MVGAVIEEMIWEPTRDWLFVGTCVGILGGELVKGGERRKKKKKQTWPQSKWPKKHRSLAHF